MEKVSLVFLTEEGEIFVVPDGVLIYLNMLINEILQKRKCGHILPSLYSTWDCTGLHVEEKISQKQFGGNY